MRFYKNFTFRWQADSNIIFGFGLMKLDLVFFKEALALTNIF